MGLTCRAWFRICAPQIYRVVYVSSSASRCVDALRHHLSNPNSVIGLHAQALVISGQVPWLALPKLLERMPRVNTLTHAASDKKVASRSKVATAYPPTISHLTSVIMAASSSVLGKLYLVDHHFSSVKDILPLLALFPRLSQVNLLTQVTPRSSEAQEVPSSKSTFDLKQADIYYTWGLGNAACLARWWQRYCPGDPESTPAGAVYPGLHKTDTRDVVTLLTLLFDLKHVQ